MKQCQTLIFLILFHCTQLVFPLNKDTLSHKTIKEVIISTEKPTAFHIENKGRIYWDIKSLESLPHLFGSADPIRFLQLLPGVSTNNDYSSGLHIQGCESSQTLTDIGGASIFNASHLLGLFSTINNSHFRGMSLTKNRHDASFGNRLGGNLSFYPIDSLAACPHLNLTISMIESSGTLTLPTSKKSTLYISGRGSYLNLFYKNLLKTEDENFKYGMQDYNATLIYHPSTTDKINMHLFYSNDGFGYSSNEYMDDNKITWNNVAASVNHTKFMNNVVLQQNLSFSSYKDHINLNLNEVNTNMNASICQINYKNNAEWNKGRIKWKGGIEYTYYHIHPLCYEIQGSFINNSLKASTEQGHDANIFAGMTRSLSKRIELDAGFRFSLYYIPNKFYTFLEPRITLLWQIKNNHELTLHYGIYHQNIHQITLSNGGLPIDYWISSSQNYGPQLAHSTSLGYHTFSENRTYELSAEIYFKHLSNQKEFYGSILDVMQKGNTADDFILQGKGINYGIDVMVKRNGKHLSGWIGYSWGKSLRQFPQLHSTQWFYSDFDRRHDLTLAANYKLNEYWSFGGDFVFATGTPYTASENIYIINNNLVNEYGTYNGSNLPPNHRLDVSATFHFKERKRIKHSLNFSVYNVYAHRNVLFEYMGYKKGYYGKKSVYSLCRILPSLGYTLKF